MPTLESLSDLLFTESDRLLGDPFTYTPWEGEPLELVNFAEHSEIRRDFGGSAAISSDAAIEVPKAVLPVWDKRDVIQLPRTAMSYNPRDVRTDESGRYWRMLLKKVQPDGE